MKNYKQIFEENNVEIIYVEDMLFSLKWNTKNAEIQNIVNDFLQENNLTDGTRLTGNCNVNLKGKNVNLTEQGFEAISQEEYMMKYW